MYSKKQLKLFDYKVLGKLPNLFLFDNGEPVKNLEDWNRRREEIYRTAVEIQFGTLPPSPDYTEVELLSEGKQQRSYKVICGRHYRNKKTARLSSMVIWAQTIICSQALLMLL